MLTQECILLIFSLLLKVIPSLACFIVRVHHTIENSHLSDPLSNQSENSFVLIELNAIILLATLRVLHL